MTARRVKSGRQFWKNALQEALSFFPDKELQSKADLYMRHPGAKFVLEIIHHESVQIANATKFMLRPQLYLEILTDRIKFTVQ